MDRVGPYRILRALETESTEGTSSFVAREEGPVGFRRDVVLKLVADGDPAHALAAEELAQEAKLGSRLNHPNIVRTHDFFAQSGRFVLVLEHVDGVTLAELLASLRARQERLSDSMALYAGVAVLEALAHAHAQVDAAGLKVPIVHGRLDPSRVVLGKDGSVKLAGGFALPAAIQPTFSPGDTVLAGSTGAPEGAEKADVRAAGLLLWEMLTGREASTAFEPLSAVRSDLPRELSAAVGAAIDVGNAKRPISCAEVASWIKKVARFAAGRDELRGRVTAIAPATDAEPQIVDAESARIPLSGWSVRLGPIASRVRSVGARLPRLDAAARDRLTEMRTWVAARWPKLDAVLRRHRRVSRGFAVGAVLVLTLVTMMRIFSRTEGKSNAASHALASMGAHDRVVPAAPSPPIYASTFAVDAAAPTRAAITTPHAVAPPSASVKAPPSAPPTQLIPEKSTPSAPAAEKPAQAVLGSAPKSGPAPPKGFGFLTVHSSIDYASVYVQLFRYGHVERRLTVRCGKRFISLGNPRPGGGEPIWFAPSRTIDVPCGGSLELTMMPKWIP